MTHAELIIVALADSCCDDLGTIFTESEIAWISWHRFPDMFCISGHPEHPCTKKVSALLFRSGFSSPIAKNWIKRDAKGKYQITPEGMAAIGR